MTDRLDRLRALAADRGADGLLVTFGPDVRWACGFTGSNGLLAVLPGAAYFLTDGRYTEQAKAEVRGADVHVVSGELAAALGVLGVVAPGTRLLVQADHVALAAFDALGQALPAATLVPDAGLLPPLVAVKTADEVARIERAQRLTERVFEAVVATLRVGMTERAVAAEIVAGHLRGGAERMAFDPIVASGPNGALPHARPTDRPLGPGELVVIDVGGVVDGYASDMTRTVALGEPEAEARHVYGTVLDAQEAAIRAARAGMRTDELDGVARGVIAEAGYGEAFAHGLGHGIGLQTHEWPRVSHQRQDVLPDGCVVTIEPGVYLPGRFGVRIEDLVYLRPDGARNLTRTPKALRVVG